MKNIIIILVAVLIMGFGYASLKNNSGEAGTTTNKQKVVVYKSPTCGCCENYIAYLKREGYEVEVKNSDVALSQIKSEKNVPGNVQSCHTTIAGDYYIEGHIPVGAISKLLEEKPNIAGIAMPGMPQGSPGMPGVKKGSFNIMSVSHEGDVSSFVTL